MKVTVVVDNSISPSAKKPFLAEHGLSLLIELDGYRILLDAGQTGIAVHNLGLLGIHSNQLDAIVVSHGHYDHTGGIPTILRQRCKSIPIYAHEEVFKKRYSNSSQVRRYIGIPFVKEDSIALGAEWNFKRNPVEIAPNLWFSGSIPRKTGFEQVDANLVVNDECGCDCQDFLLDDTALYYISEKGLVVIVGCAHSGVVNTISRGFEITGCTKLAGWIGGTHLGPASTDQQKQTLAALGEYNPEFIAANHCTGFAMMAELKQYFGSKFIPAFVGTVIEV